MQRIFRPVVPTIAVTRRENVALQEARLSAQRDALRRLGHPQPSAPVDYDLVKSRLRIIERTADGAIRAEIVVEMGETRIRYRRSLHVVTGEPRGAPRSVELRVVP